VPESTPHIRFEVEKVIGISSDGNYQVQWAPAWVSKFHLVGCEHLIQEFLQQQTVKINKMHMQIETEHSSYDGGMSDGITGSQTQDVSPECDDRPTKDKGSENRDSSVLSLENVVNQFKDDGERCEDGMINGNPVLDPDNSHQELSDAVSANIKVENVDETDEYEMLYPSISSPLETNTEQNMYQGYHHRRPATSGTLAVKIPRLEHQLRT